MKIQLSAEERNAWLIKDRGGGFVGRGGYKKQETSGWLHTHRDWVCKYEAGAIMVCREASPNNSSTRQRCADSRRSMLAPG